MEIVFLLLFMAVLGHIGWTDYKTRLISDFDLALLWILVGLIEMNLTFSAYFLCGAILAVSYFGLYSLPIVVFKKPIIRFGDILLFPVMLAFSFLMFGQIGIYFSGAVLGISLIISFKKELPFGTVMAGFGLLLLALHYFNGVV